MIEYILAALALGYGFIIVRDFHKFIKKSYEAIDRDQQMLDQITEHDPEYLTFEEAEIVAVHVADMSREQAIFAFMDAYDKRYSNDHRAD